MTDQETAIILAAFVQDHPDAREGIFSDGHMILPVAKLHVQWLVAQGLVGDQAKVSALVSYLTQVEMGEHQ